MVRDEGFPHLLIPSPVEPQVCYYPTKKVFITSSYLLYKEKHVLVAFFQSKKAPFIKEIHENIL